METQVLGNSLRNRRILWLGGAEKRRGLGIEVPVSAAGRVTEAQREKHDRIDGEADSLPA